MSKLEQEFKKETNTCPIEGVDLYKIKYISWLEEQIQQLQADKEELDKQAKTIRAGIMNYHDGKISFNQLMELQKDSTQEG